jgi:cysteinyl-tRNA synthetase
MSLKYLGQTLDIHGGGQDLIFPHHENEIAQSESFTGVKPFVRHWLHNGLLQLGEEKMSKSTGKLVTINEALAKYSPDALRLWVLSSHYRSPITYSDENLEATEKGIERLVRAAHLDIEESTAPAIDAQPYRERFIEAMDDDFNTPQAVAALFDLVREINRGRDEGIGIIEAHKAFLQLTGVLGLTLKESATPELASELLLSKLTSKYLLNWEELSDDPKEWITKLTERRAELRRLKQWQLADSIRNDLKELGIILEDTSEGTISRYKKP